MTSIVGILCSDGVVIGSDSAATFGNSRLRTIEQPCEKLTVIDGRIIVAGTGEVGLGQRFCDVVQKAWNDKQFGSQPIEVGRVLASRAIQDFSQTGVKLGQYGALLAYAAGGTFHLGEFSVDNFQPEWKTRQLWFTSMGSAQMITDPFLAFLREVFWENDMPTVQNAIFAITWTLDHAIHYNPGGVNGPPRVAVIEKQKGQYGARILSEVELDEHQQSILAAKDSLRCFRERLQPEGSSAAVPTAEAQELTPTLPTSN